MASRSESTRSTATLHVPIEITIDILLRLPVKSLLRFQSVCKNWYALIRSPNFISQHKTTHSTPSFSSLLVTHFDVESNVYDMSLHYNDSFDVPVYVYFPFLVRSHAVSVVGVCDGLVCLSLSRYGHASMILCNPATRQFREFPDFKLDKGPFVGIYRVTFGFDPSANDYKLIRIMYFECPDGWVVRADAYPMSTGTWREIDDGKLSVFYGDADDVLLLNESSSASAVLNGVFYWAAMDFSGEMIFMSFDMGNEVFRKVRTPQCLDEVFQKVRRSLDVVWDERNWRVMQMEDKLALVMFHPDDECFDVWVLNENQMSWTNQFKFGAFPRIESPVGCGENGKITVMGFGKNGVLVMTDHNESGDMKLFLYNPKSQETKNLCFGQVPSRSSICLYTETVLPVNENNGIVFN